VVVPLLYIYNNLLIHFAYSPPKNCWFNLNRPPQSPPNIEMTAFKTISPYVAIIEIHS
jgi:hypothetical protein